MKQTIIWIGLSIALLALVACESPAEESNRDQTEVIPKSVSCEVYYRSAPGRPLGGSALTLSTDGAQEALDFDDLRFEATFLSDAGEGKSLSVVVMDVNGRAELARGLYQIDPQKGLNNQFVGGHGFTGLIYVFQPVSDSEVQYFCAAGS